jgi:hypothetical protein
LPFDDSYILGYNVVRTSIKSTTSERKLLSIFTVIQDYTLSTKATRFTSIRGVSQQDPNLHRYHFHDFKSYILPFSSGLLTTEYTMKEISQRKRRNNNYVQCGTFRNDKYENLSVLGTSNVCQNWHAFRSYLTQ